MILNTFLTVQCTFFTLFVHLIRLRRFFRNLDLTGFSNKIVIFHKHIFFCNNKTQCNVHLGKKNELHIDSGAHSAIMRCYVAHV